MRRGARRAVAALFANLVAALALTACGGGSDAGADANPASAAATTSATPASAAAASNVRRSAAAVVPLRDAAVTSTVAAPLAWVQCAQEGGYCSFSGERDVRYGTAASSVTLRLAGGTACSNAVFGDPAFGEVKSCAYADDGTTPATAWVFCAYEWQTCSFTGTRQVRYGTLSQNVTAVFADGTGCSNLVFGDPVFGTVKSCWYEDRPIESVPAGQMIGCAGENQFCAFTGTRSVRYGTPTLFATGTFTGGVACANEVFGDPAVGTYKTCSYSAETVATAPAPTPAPGASGANPPVVFNASRSARAGDVVSVQGDNFGSAPRVWLESAPGTPLEIVNRVDTGWLAVQLPATAQGALVLRVANATGTSAQVKLNAAVPYHLDTLQVTNGGAFRVFGRNLLATGYTPRVSIDGVVARVDTNASDEHMLSVVAPATLRASSAVVITVDNGNGSGAATLDRTIQAVVGDAGDPFQLGTGWGAGFAALNGRSVQAGSDPRLAARMVCDGTRDDAPALQAAIDLAAASGGAVVRVPAGRCRLGGGMALKSKVVVEGAGKTSTELVYESDYPVYAVGVDLAGVRNLTLTNSGRASEGPLLKDSTRVVVQGVRVRLGTSRQMYLSGNRQIVVADSDFEQTGSISNQGPYTFADSAGLVFQRNTTRWVDGAPAFGRVRDSFLAANRFTRDATPQQNQGGAVHSMTLDFAHRVAVVGNTFDVAGGPITNKTRNDGETILTEGGATQRTENLGSVTAAGATTLTDAANTLQVDPFGTGSVPENYGIAIVGGKGAGQTRRVVAYTRPTLTVDRAWDVLPDTTSRYATFVWGLEKSLIKGNTLTQNPRGIWLYHTAIREVDVIGNAISEGGGIYLRSYQNLATKSFMPIWNVLIARNSVVNTTGHWMSYVEAVFVNSDARAFGIANLGIEMRANQLTANRPNVYSGSEEYAGMEGYANMMRVENYNGYESSPTPRLLGSIVAGNSCSYCDVAVRIGTGAGGTTVLGTQLTATPKLLEDWATTSTPEKSTATVIR